MVTPLEGESSPKTFEPALCKLQHIVPVTLEEVQSGIAKRVEFVRRIRLSATACDTEHVVVTLDIKPGMPDETQFRFDGKVRLRLCK